MKALSDNVRGALMMAVAMLAFSSNDAAMKSLSGELPLFQAIFLRGIVTTIAMIILAGLFGQLRLRLGRQDFILICVRSLAEVAAAWTFLTALFNMQLANVTAILQALPLVMTFAGALFLKEPIGWRRLSASIIGFVGVLMIVQPGGESFNIYSIYALLSVGLIVIRDLAARRMSRDVPSMFAATFAAGTVTAFAGFGSMFIEWTPVTGHSAALLSGAATAVLIGYLMSVTAMRVGEISFVAPFRYVGLLASLILGVVIFGQLPSTLALLGCVVVVGSGLFIFRRERQLSEVEAK
ncbi:DMT family transporter [Marivivens donghaensis]|uniref:DMT family transporter n=1 Tax=Marivivens donghaensis TaxID=1699413 RepID=UPI00201F35C9|nr:DMT family transporter [Marivivens donghaensis]MCL7408633.1 DMT family transporter [Marivivens donghaensis]MDN3705339.1 DMT family transporter [Marivivens donghaensis]